MEIIAFISIPVVLLLTGFIIWSRMLQKQVTLRTHELSAEISKHKRAKKALSNEKNNLMNIFQAMQDGVYIVNQNYDIKYVNPVLTKDFGSYEGRKCYEYFHDRTEVCTWCKNSEIYAGKTVHWEWTSAKNQKTYDLIDTPLKDPDDGILKLEIFRDITERKQDEIELKGQLNELHRWRNIMQGRVEKEMVLKAEINALLTESGRPPRYPSVENNRDSHD